MGKLRFHNCKKDRGCRLAVKNLYEEAFPSVERMPFGMLAFLARGERAGMYGIYDGTEFVGMAYLVYYRDIVFLFYLAVEERRRSCGYGTRILRILKKKYARRRIILNMEEVDPEAENLKQRLNRRLFYGNNGFKSLNYTITEAGVAYEMLIAANGNGPVTKAEFLELMQAFFGRFLYRVFYQRILMDAR